MTILILAGYSGAGKSTIGSLLESRYHFSFIRHQPLVHELAISKGFSRARYWLESVGIDEFCQDSENEIIERLKKLPEVKVVLDVAYGKKMLEKIKTSFPERKIYVVHISARQSVREQRISQRMNAEIETAKKEREFRDNFLDEVGLNEVLEYADLIIDNIDSSEISAEKIVKSID